MWENPYYLWRAEHSHQWRVNEITPVMYMFMIEIADQLVDLYCWKSDYADLVAANILQCVYIQFFILKTLTVQLHQCAPRFLPDYRCCAGENPHFVNSPEREKNHYGDFHIYLSKDWNILEVRWKERKQLRNKKRGGRWEWGGAGLEVTCEKEISPPHSNLSDRPGEGSANTPRLTPLHHSAAITLSLGHLSVPLSSPLSLPSFSATCSQIYFLPLSSTFSTSSPAALPCGRRIPRTSWMGCGLSFHVQMTCQLFFSLFSLAFKSLTLLGFNFWTFMHKVWQQAETNEG